MAVADAVVVAVEVEEHRVVPRWHRTIQVVEQDEVELAVAAVAEQVGSAVVGKVAEVALGELGPAVEADTKAMSRLRM